MMKYFTLTLIALFQIITSNVASQNIKELTKNLDVVYFDGFYEKSLQNYQFTTPANWILTENGTPGSDLKCQMAQNTEASQFFPLEMAMIHNMTFGDFVVEFNYIQRSRDFSMRDICLIYAYQDSLNYCFAQAASESGKYKHNIFKVEGDRPLQIGTINSNGVVWSYQKWQHIVIRRKAMLVELYLDGNLVMQTETDAGTVGKMAIGTFGSDFKIDNLKIWAVKEAKTSKK